MNLGAARVTLAIAHANRARRRDGTGGDTERVVNALFEADRKLVVYGTLMAGERNAHLLASIDGTWRACRVHGTLHAEGWGAAMGFPAIRLDPTAPQVEARLFESPALPDHWARLDRFEGDEYRRVLVPVHDGQAIIAVANIYEAREIPSR